MISVIFDSEPDAAGRVYRVQPGLFAGIFAEIRREPAPLRES
jgi:hypothetical protein